MKFFHRLSVFLAFTLVFGITACGNDDDDGDGGSVIGECSASWTLDGVDYEQPLALCAYLNDGLTLSETLTASGSFVLILDPVTTTGTYEHGGTGSNDPSVTLILQLEDGTTLFISSGEVVLTELTSGRAKGTFSGSFYDITDTTLTPSFVVTNGVFEASF